VGSIWEATGWNSGPCLNSWRASPAIKPISQSVIRRGPSDDGRPNPTPPRAGLSKAPGHPPCRHVRRSYERYFPGLVLRGAFHDQITRCWAGYGPAGSATVVLALAAMARVKRTKSVSDK
jgi:hypothetical protein